MVFEVDRRAYLLRGSIINIPHSDEVFNLLNGKSRKELQKIASESGLKGNFTTRQLLTKIITQLNNRSMGSVEHEHTPVHRRIPYKELQVLNYMTQN